MVWEDGGGNPASYPIWRGVAWTMFAAEERHDHPSWIHRQGHRSRRFGPPEGGRHQARIHLASEVTDENSEGARTMYTRLHAAMTARSMAPTLSIVHATAPVPKP